MKKVNDKSTQKYLFNIVKRLKSSSKLNFQKNTARSISIPPITNEDDLKIIEFMKNIKIKQPFFW